MGLSPGIFDTIARGIDPTGAMDRSAEAQQIQAETAMAPQRAALLNQQTQLAQQQAQAAQIENQQRLQQLRDASILRYAMMQEAAQSNPNSVAAPQAAAPAAAAPTGPVPQNPLGVPASPMLPWGAGPAGIAGTAPPAQPSAAPAQPAGMNWNAVLQRAMAGGATANVAALIKPYSDLEKDWASTANLLEEAGQKRAAAGQTAAETERKIQDQAAGAPLKQIKDSGYDPQAAPRIFQAALDLIPQQFAPGEAPRAAQYLRGLAQAASSAATADGLKSILEPVYENTTASKNEADLNAKNAEAGKSKADAVKAQADADLAAAQTPGARAKSEIEKAQAAALGSLTPDTIGRQVDAEMDALKAQTTDKNILKSIEAERGVAKAAATSALPGGYSAVQAAIKDSVDRIGRLSAGVAQAAATVPSKIAVTVGGEQARNQANALSPEAVDMAAEMFRKTGELPSFGMSNPYARKQILDAAAKLGPIDIATEQASFRANEASLKQLQEQSDRVTAFENTAGKNLDLFLQQAKNVVDSGSPWINSPLRTVAKGALGSADQAAYETARQVAVNEIAKVVSNPNLTGQLSDTARKEVSTFNPNNATLAQTYRVAQILKQDMRNRLDSNNEQIASIKSRIGGGGGGDAGGGRGGKVATTAHVAGYAAKKGITVEQATKEFTDSGYRIQ